MKTAILLVLAQIGIPSHVLSTIDVSTMLSRLPACERCATAWRYDLAPGAPDVALAIVSTVDGSLTGSARLDAALMATYGALESGLRRCARGDGGKALGIWQLQGVPQNVACDPRAAARVWYSIAKASTAACEGLDVEERLAALASGSCDRARGLARRRFELARRIVD